MKQPTKKQIQDAKDFIKLRLQAEISMQSHLEELLVQAAKEIIDISFKYDIQPAMFRFSANENLKRDVSEVLRKLRELIYDYTETLSVYDRKEERDAIVDFINREDHGKTLSERIGIYCNRFQYEVEAAIAAGLIAGIGKDKIKNSVKSYLNAPYANPFFKRAADNGGAAATRIKTDGVSYGVGKSNSAYNSLNTLTRFAVGSAWMLFWGLEHKDKGYTGFYSYRGSSYPCSYCDSMVGYHPISDYQNQWHIRCCCYFVFV